MNEKQKKQLSRLLSAWKLSLEQAIEASEENPCLHYQLQECGVMLPCKIPTHSTDCSCGGIND